MTTPRPAAATRRARKIALLFAFGFAVAAPLAAQDTTEVTTEFFPAKHQTLVRMGKLSLDDESKLGAFYSFAGQAQQAPVPELTLHVVHSGAQWAYLEGYDVVIVLDDKTRIPLPRARRVASVGEGFTLEQIFIALPRAQADQIAHAQKVRMQVGPKQFVWTDSLQQTFREISARADGAATSAATR
jgi:hypothetical protein